MNTFSGRFVLDPNGDTLKYFGNPPYTDTMAFDMSIAKWEKIVSIIESHKIIPKDGGPSTCGLCQCFISCRICPIGKDDHQGCEKTAYATYVDARNNKDLGGALRAAYEEITYLELLKKQTLERLGEDQL